MALFVVYVAVAVLTLGIGVISLVQNDMTRAAAFIALSLAVSANGRHHIKEIT